MFSTMFWYASWTSLKLMRRIIVTCINQSCVFSTRYVVDSFSQELLLSSIWSFLYEIISKNVHFIECCTSRLASTAFISRFPHTCKSYSSIFIFHASHGIAHFVICFGFVIHSQANSREVSIWAVAISSVCKNI